jgi:hypothetical protein
MMRECVDKLRATLSADQIENGMLKPWLVEILFPLQQCIYVRKEGIHPIYVIGIRNAV